MIPDEAIDAAAKELHAKVCGGMADGWFCAWECSGWESYKEPARAALESASPYLKAEALAKAADDAEGLGMTEIPVHSLRFRADCYRNIGANLYGGKA